MTVELLSQIAGALLALGMAYIPGLKTWYSGKDENPRPPEQKGGIMAILLIVVAAGVYGLACSGLGADFGLAIACDKASAVLLVKVLVSALIANQATFLLGVRPFKS